ncbi:MAG TPA: FAD-dependent oxidoreductase [Intrasporangium sp.]|uniref:FAD-dependent oxidoreductase n=1 Tax=Intrasporangium sp. TaxID=1925024 RepID=UPI002B490AA8|nr:FAD-dependent oxidoreductase [Intrasporangium sp.]HKX65767.1 FAD-dependent oxidoreductase [Intrasporangium sp.]
MRSSKTDKARIVILGGGMAGLVTAWELSSAGWRDRLDSITVYQRGWRLGGKGASSRGPHGRIQEHGLHVLLGCYDATFRVLREVYGELDRGTTDPGCPIRTWRDALEPAGDVGLADWDGAEWTHFVTRFSGNTMLPGEPGAEDRSLGPLDVASRVVGLLMDFHAGLDPPCTGPTRPYLSVSPVPRTGTTTVETAFRAGALTALAVLAEVLERAARAAGPMVLDAPALNALGVVVETWRDEVRPRVLAEPALRRTWLLVDLVVACLQGMVADGLLSSHDFGGIDHLDFREWIATHGAAPETLDSPIVRGMHELTFAFEGGHHHRPRFSAGLGLQLAGRMLFDYKGSVFWRMRAGMGEVVFAPMYQALARRGVEFRFFHRLDRLVLAGDRSIGSVELTRQADLVPPRNRYEPLIRVAGLPCWPDKPLVDQLGGDPGDRSESHWGPTEGAGPERLVAGADFDTAVLAVSVGMVPYVASELVVADPAWRRMVANIGTVATQAAQLWMDASPEDLGWSGPDGVTLTGFGQSFATWAAMSHLLPKERWPANGAPRSIAYLCGPIPDDRDGADQDGADSLVRERLRHFLDDEVGALWPGATDSRGFRWQLLRDDEGRSGPDRLAAQYLRANVDPSDRYVQSLPGSGRHRLAAGRTGFGNLAVVGDWTACGFDAGSLEAATRSGILAARSIASGEASGGARGEAAR